MKPFLILQLRAVDAVADNEYEAFLHYGSLRPEETLRIRMEKQSLAGLDARRFAGVIMGGGPSNVSDRPDLKPDFQHRFEAELIPLFDQIFAEDVPYLGVCFGLGAVVSYAGGRVAKERYAEPAGHTTIHLLEAAASDPLLQGLPPSFTAFAGHKEACQFVPEGAVLLASSDACPVQMIRFRENIYATQFHTELDRIGIILRIHHYMNHGYFEPESADALIEEVKHIRTDTPHQILRRFVERYG